MSVLGVTTGPYLFPTTETKTDERSVYRVLFHLQFYGFKKDWVATRPLRSDVRRYWSVSSLGLSIEEKRKGDPNGEGIV